MRTTRLLTVSHWAGGCLPRGGFCPGGVYPRGVSPGGVYLGGVCPDQRQTPPPREQNDWQTGVKTLPCHNFAADGNKKTFK